MGLGDDRLGARADEPGRVVVGALDGHRLRPLGEPGLAVAAGVAEVGQQDDGVRRELHVVDGRLAEVLVRRVVAARVGVQPEPVLRGRVEGVAIRARPAVAVPEVDDDRRAVDGVAHGRPGRVGGVDLGHLGAGGGGLGRGLVGEAAIEVRQAADRAHHEDDTRHARSGGHGRHGTHDGEHRHEERDQCRARDPVQRFTLPTPEVGRQARSVAYSPYPRIDPHSSMALRRTDSFHYSSPRDTGFFRTRDRRVPSADGRTGRRPSPHEQARGRDEPLPAPACAQPRGLDAVGTRCVGSSQAARPADLPVDRVRRLSLVPRDGARVVRGRGDGRRAERGIRRDQGRPRGAPRPRPAVHGRRPDDDRGRRLADERVPHARGPAVLRRHLLPRHAAPRDAVVPPGARGRPDRVDDAAAGGGAGGGAARRRAGRVAGASGPAAGPSGCRRASRSTPPRPRSRPRSTRSTAAGDARRSSRSR